MRALKETPEHLVRVQGNEKTASAVRQGHLQKHLSMLTYAEYNYIASNQAWVMKGKYNVKVYDNHSQSKL